jgi:hypothetical protein
MAEQLGNEGIADPNEDLGTDDAALVARWCLELDAARKGPYKRWLTRAKKAIRRYRDEDVDAEDGAVHRRNAQFNVLWSNVQTVAPSVYSRGPKPVAERRYLDRDVIARAASTILQRSLGYVIEDSGLHETMLQCRTDYFLVGLGDAWVRYQAEYAPTEAQHQQPEEPVTTAQVYPGELDAPGKPKVTKQKICVDYSHWSDGLVSPARFWSEITWRAKRAYYTRRQLVKLCGKETAQAIPLQVTRGKKQNDVTDQVKEAIGKAEVWQIWDLETGDVLWICEGYKNKPLKKEDGRKLKLSTFWPSARPVRGTHTNDSFWPIPDYSIWHDQAAELDSLTARIAALTRAIKAVGVFDQSQPELERLLNEGMENKLLGVKNWAKLVQRGGLEGSVGLLPIKEMADALTALYMARAQVKNDLYEISGVSDIVRGASDPNETAAAQKMKGQFSSVRGSDRKNEFNRFVRDTLVIMAEVLLEHFTDDMLWLMSDFEQWAASQDLRTYQPEPMPHPMGHNGGPAMGLDQAPPVMPGLPGPTQAAAPAGGIAPSPIAQQVAGAGPGAPASAPYGNGGAPGPELPMASSPGNPPMPGLPMPAQARPPMPGPGPAIPPNMPPGPPPGPPPLTPRQLFDEALALLREDKLRSFRIMVETNSTIEPDATEEKQARVEFLGAVTGFLKQAQEMGQAYPQTMPALGKMLLWGARGFQAGREMESALEGLIADLEEMARNPKPKPPSPDEIKAKALEQKGQLDLQKMQLDMQADRQRMQMEMQKLQQELEAEREKLQLKLQEILMKIDGQQKLQAVKMQGAEQEMALKSQVQQQDAANQMVLGNQELQREERRGELEERSMDRQASHQERTLDRQEAHDETKMELAEKAARSKAAAAAKTGASAGNGKGSR